MEMKIVEPDFERMQRCGIPEVVYGQGKSQKQLLEVCARMLGKAGRVIVTKVDLEKADSLAGKFDGCLFSYNEDAGEITYSDTENLGFAVDTDQGLLSPVIHNAGDLSLAGLARAIVDIAARARSGNLKPDELSGGTFTITNGGVYGSMMSTPIVNYPQSAILGMHAIMERPVALQGQVVIRPMMYLALSYDHRIIDGREAVQFLKKVKEYIEEPEEMLLEG